MQLSPSICSFIPAQIVYELTSYSLESQRPPHVLTPIPLHGTKVGSRTPMVPNLNYQQFLKSEDLPSETIPPFLTNITESFLFHPSSPNPPSHSPAKAHKKTGENGCFDRDSPDMSSGMK
ncbi:hypothetical protein O181_080696 [Austropuccinia psidii MF-1]|uniref:Uncharacterized protein n=1 Tax=Austropuccinia psidii MF-1 TaxID=1389203 RepID=A0A9Q3FP99_9BASI|nr:hypothetical protein [Austropuccinia psidii MF-1]